MSRICYQINLWPGFGGSEVYTRFFSHALQSIGWQSVLFVHRRAAYWQDMDLSGVTLIPVDSPDEIISHLPTDPGLFITHTPLYGKLADQLDKHHIFTGFVHQPLYGKDLAPYQHCHLLFGVSRHILDSIRAVGISQYYPDPLYGVADLDRLRKSDDSPLSATSAYDWDKRKLRDRLLSHLEPAYRAVAPARTFTPKPGLTLGIVSRITTIKQFPLMFELLSPVIRKFPTVNLEIFGSGGYASMRDLKRSLTPISHQVRFWGHQSDIRKVYPLMDFLLSGLPEREGMGLNLLEAQLSGTPVMAVDAPPFNEGVIHGKTGFLYTDPRLDQGQSFEALLTHLIASDNYPKPLEAPECLEIFSFEQFTQRLELALNQAISHMNYRKARHATEIA